MKNLLIIAAVALASITANAFTSGQSDPQNGSPDADFRTIVKTETAGTSAAIAVGDILTYDTANFQDGYTVTSVGENSVVGAARMLCVATKAIATGNTSETRCQSRGFVQGLKFDAATPFSLGSRLCSNAVGAAVACATCDTVGSTNDCKLGTASGNSIIISLQPKGAGTGSGATGIKAYILAK